MPQSLRQSLKTIKYSYKVYRFMLFRKHIPRRLQIINLYRFLSHSVQFDRFVYFI